MRLVQLLLQVLLALPRLRLLVQVLLLQVLVVEVPVQVLVIVNPPCHHVRVLLVVVPVRGLPIQKHWLVVAEVVCVQSVLTVKQHFPPQVRVRTTLVHRSIRLEVLLHEQLVLLEHKFNLLLILRVENLVEVLSDFVLLIVEAVEVWSAHCEHMLCDEFPQRASENK